MVEARFPVLAPAFAWQKSLDDATRAAGEGGKLVLVDYWDPG